jgi:hypothetical protein
MMLGELLVHELVISRQREADREGLARAALARPRHRAGEPRIELLTRRLRIARLAIRRALPRLGGGQA